MPNKSQQTSHFTPFPARLFISSQFLHPIKCHWTIQPQTGSCTSQQPSPVWNLTQKTEKKKISKKLWQNRYETTLLWGQDVPGIMAPLKDSTSCKNLLSEEKHRMENIRVVRACFEKMLGQSLSEFCAIQSAVGNSCGIQ